MKIMIMTDLEGPSGINGRADSVGNKTVNLPIACQALVDEVNATVQGLVAGGADEIVVWDGHGGSNSIDIMKLHAPAMLGTIGGPMHPACFCDASFDAIIQIGAHALQGTPDGYMCHSFNSHGVCNMWLNDELIGEIGIESRIASYFKVPTILVGGDVAACREAKALMPDVTTVATKKGISRYTVIDRNPADVQADLRKAAEKAVKNIKKYKVLPTSKHYVFRLELMCENSACGYEMRGWERIAHNMVQTKADNIIDIFAQYCGWAPGIHNKKYGITPKWKGLVF